MNNRSVVLDIYLEAFWSVPPSLPMYRWISTGACVCMNIYTLKYKQFRVQKGSDSPLPSVLQVIYCINQPASGKCPGSDYTIIHNTISMKHLSRPIHQSLIQ